MPKRDRTAYGQSSTVYRSMYCVSPGLHFRAFLVCFAFCIKCISGLRDQLSAWFPSKSHRSPWLRESNSRVSFYHKRQGSRMGPSLPCAPWQLRSPHQHYTIAKTLSVVTLNCLPLLELTSGACLLTEPVTTLGTDLTKEAFDNSVQ